MRKALYRKWRPATFADVVGQEVITKTLQNQIESDKIVHAYLFTGSRGTGKTTCSKILAKAINCQNPQGGNPCGECAFCRGIEDGSILDVIEMDAASNNKVDDIRLLREEINYTPAQLKYRVYIIDEVHMLSTSAFNALLKVMEEPPSYVVFILATTELHKVPATIVSRCQRFDFKRITPIDIGQRLLYIASQEGITLEEGAAKLIGVLSDGGMRDAISLLDLCCATTDRVTEELVRQVAGVGDRLSLFALLQAIGKRDTSAALLTLQEMYTGSADAKRITEQLLEVFRDLMLSQNTKDPQGILECSPEELSRFADLSGDMDSERCIACLELLGQCYDKMNASFQKRTLLEMTLIKLCTLGETGLDSPRHSAPGIKQAARGEVASSTQSGGAATKPSAAKKTEKRGDMPPEGQTAEIEEPAPQQAAMEAEAEKPPKQEAIDVAAEKAAEPQGQKRTPVPEEGDQAAAPAVPQEAAKTQTAAGATDFQKIEDWNRVAEVLAKTNPAVYGYLMGTSGYLKEGVVYIQAGGMLFTLLKGNTQAKNSVEEAIAQVLGRKYRIDRYTGGEGDSEIAAGKSGSSAVSDILQRARELGVDCEEGK